MVQNEKNALRKSILDRLVRQKEEDRIAKSLSIQHKLFNLQAFLDAALILFYASFDGEVDTIDMIKKAMNMGKKIALPKVLKDTKELVPVLVKDLNEDLETGTYGIQEPKYTQDNQLELSALDLVIVPGLAFDREHHRLGRGAGYYDRFLSRLPSHIPTVGLAFDFQFVDRLPITEEHDVPLTHVLFN